MINGLEGIPGSGKSYEAAVFQVLAALREGRKVITNLPLNREAYAAIDPAYGPLLELRYVPAPVRGTWDAERVDPESGKGQAFTLFEDGRQEPPPDGARLFGQVWDYWSDWKHPKTGKGPLFIVDECHVAMPKIGTDKAVIEWYKLHRHFNVDVLLATQRFRQMCQDIAEIMAMVIKVRKADILGKPDSYIRKVHAGYRGEVVQTSERRYEPHFFALYTSHTQGSAVLESQATDVNVLPLKIKRWTRIGWGVSALCVAFAVWVWSTPKAKTGAPATHAGNGGNPAVNPDGSTNMDFIRSLGKPGNAAEAASGAIGQVDPGKQSEASSAAPDALPDPFAGKTLHLTGHMSKGGRTVHLFAMAVSGAVVSTLTSEELEAAGYRWVAKGSCIGYLVWGTSPRAVVCDAPVRQSGSPDKPLAVVNGSWSDGRVPAPPSAGPGAQGMPPPLGGRL